MLNIGSRHRFHASTQLWRLLGTGALVAALAWQAPQLSAQVLADALAPPSTVGLERLDRFLARLSGHHRLLVVAAHPDDEDTTLLTLVAKDLGGEAAYLSLNRGEGGQNLIGPELGEGLGLIRSRELMAARNIDGARQFFSRAFDFGYTRSLEETLGRWPEQELLEDAVRVVRRFRPQVVVSIFQPDARAGHGQHQTAGLIARKVFHLAGDPEAFAGLEGLAPWQPEALYQAARSARDVPALEFPLGDLDPISGKSYLQIALDSRSQHRSQDMGRLQRLGSRNNRLIPLAGKATGEGAGPFAGLDTRLTALAAPLGSSSSARGVRTALASVENAARATRDALSAATLGGSAEALAGIVRGLSAARQSAIETDGVDARERAAVVALIDEKLHIAAEGLATAAGLVADAATDSEMLVPGQGVEVRLELWNSGSEKVEIRSAELSAPEGWKLERGAPGAANDTANDTSPLAPRQLVQRAFTVTPSSEAEPSIPYFLRQPRQGFLYDWSSAPAALRGEPFDPPLLTARFTLALRGVEIHLEREVVLRRGDQARGEVRRPLRVVPKLEVAVSPSLLVWPTDETAPKAIEVRLTHHGEGVARGRLALELPTGWPPMEEPTFTVAGGGGREVLTLNIEPPSPLPPGTDKLRIAAVTHDGARFTQATPVVDYEHIRPTLSAKPAEVAIHAGELRRPTLAGSGRVGYVRGASDRIPETLRQIGVDLDLLSPTDLAEIDLGAYPVLVIGSRAYETTPELAAANDRFLDYVRGGGRLIVQYQQYQFVRGGFAPFPLEIARPHDRVTDETAPMRMLAPDHVVFNRPNRLTDADWNGWVQERGLYFAHTWDDAYRPLLATADPDGPELKGALLIAAVGEGTYVYTGLAFFRQLPAGVTGAYRLFLNLLQPER